MSEALKHNPLPENDPDEPELRLVNLDREIFRAEEASTSIPLSAMLMASLAVPVLFFMFWLMGQH